MYRTHTLKEYDEVIELRNLGWGATKISTSLSYKGIFIKKGTIAGWIYRNKKPFEEKTLKRIPENSKLLTKEKAYILGVLCGDGYIRIQNISAGYLVGLDVCDEEFADEFRRCLREVYGLLPSKKVRRRKSTNFTTTPKPQYVINLLSKLVIQNLLSYSNSFKTKDWEIPLKILKADLEIKSAFLRGLFDSEGTIRLKKKGHACLQICSGNKHSLYIIREMLKKDFDINLKSKSQRNMLILVTERYKDIKNFSDKIGFSIRRKEETLDSCLLSYKRKGLRTYDPEFKLKVLNLLEEGHSAYKIGKMLGFSHTNIYDFMKQYHKSDIQKEKGIITRK